MCMPQGLAICSFSRQRRGQRNWKVGRDVTLEQTYQSARFAGSQLAVMVHELASLDTVRRIVKVTGSINAVPEFANHSAVLNGCARSTCTRCDKEWGSTPGQIPVEIEVVVKID